MYVISIYLTTVFVVFTSVSIALVLFSDTSFYMVWLFADDSVRQSWTGAEITEVAPLRTNFVLRLVFR